MQIPSLEQSTAIPTLDTSSTGVVSQKDVPNVVSQVEAVNETVGKPTDKQLIELEVQTNSFESIKYQAEDLHKAKSDQALQAQLSLNLSNPANTTEDVVNYMQQYRDASKAAKSFETLAIENSVGKASEDGEWSDIFRNARDKSTFNKIQNEKVLFAQNKLMELRAQAEDRGIALKARDLGASYLTVKDFIDGAYATGTLNFNSRINEFGKRYFAAGTLEEAKEIMQEFEEEVLVAHVLFENKDLALRQFELGIFGREDDVILENVFSAIDVATLGFFNPVTKLFRGFRANKIAVGDTDSVAKEIAQTGSNDEIGDAVSVLKPIDYDQLSISKKTTEELKRNQAILDNAVEETFKFSQELYTSTDKAKALEELVTVAKSKDFKGDSLGAYKVRPDGIGEVEVYTQKGNPYSRKSDAQRRLDNLGLGGSVVETPQGGWVVKAEIELDDNNFIKGYQPKPIGEFGRNFYNVDSWVDSELVALGRVSEGKFGFLEDSVKKVYKDTWNNLGKDRDNLSRVFISQRESDKYITPEGERRWMTQKEFNSEYRKLTNKEPSEKVIKAWATYRQINDFMYALDNKVLFDKLASEGFKKLEGGNIPQGVNGKLSTAEAARNNKVYNSATDEIMEGSDITDEILAASDVVRVSTSSLDSFRSAGKMQDGVSEYVLVPKNSFDMKDLDIYQMPYLAGGRRAYDSNTVFIKQPNVGEYITAGKGKYRLRDKTLYTAPTMRQGKAFIEKFNKGLSLINAGKAGRNLDEIVKEFDELDMGSFKDFQKNVEKMGIDPKVEVQALRNRELASVSNDVTNDFSEVDTSINLIGNRFNSRGQEVKSIDATNDNILDPFEATITSFDTVASNASFSQYKQFAIDRFKTLFSKDLDVLPQANLNQLLNAGVKGDSKVLENTVKGHQQFIKELIGHRTADDMIWQQKVESIVGAFSKDRFLGKINLGLSSKREVALAEKLNAPSAAVRSAVFNSKLGMFNPASFIIQTLHAPVVMAIAPKHGLKSLTTYKPFRQALAISDPRATKILEEGYGKVEDSFGDLEGLTGSVDQYKRLGFDNFGGQMAYLDAANGSNALVGGRFSDLMEKGRFFFEEGESISRITAFTAARRKWIAKDDGVNPKGLKADSPEGDKWIANEAHRLMLGMSRVDMQQITKGGLKGIMTQFMSYPMRALDALRLSNETFTKAEKGRMLLAYFGLYGTAGIPLVDSLTKYIESRNGQPIQTREEKEFLDKFISNGVIDAAMLEFFDVDSNISARGGIGAFLTEIYEMLVEDSSIDMFGGAGLSTTARGLDTFRDIVRMYSSMNNPSIESFTEATVMAVGSQISTLSNSYKAYMAWNTGIMYDSYGRKLTTEMDKTAIVSMILGFTPQTYEDLGVSFQKAQWRKDIVRNGVEDILNLQRKYSEATDEKTKQELQNAVNLRFLSFEKDGIADDIVKDVNREMQSQGMIQNMIYRQQLQAMPEGEE